MAPTVPDHSEKLPAPGPFITYSIGSILRCASNTPLNALAAGRTNTLGDRRNRARFADAVEHIRWRLWHGQTGRALRLIQRTLAAVKAKAKGKTVAAR
jgi:hypothetical protein